MINLLELQKITEKIPSDIGGGSGFDKVSIMAGLADYLDLRTFIEIGVYRGRSFFPMARFLSKRNGFSYGVDPYTKADARELDITDDVASFLNRFFEETDYEAIYSDVLLKRSEFRLENNSQIIRQTSERAAQYFRSLDMVDMVHIDGNHDTKFVLNDVELYIPLIRPGGVLILDDINWDSVKPALDIAKGRMTLVHLAETYAVLVNKSLNTEETKAIEGRCRAIDRIARRLMSEDNKRPPKVSVSMITYNQEAFIAHAIESALNQNVDFDYEIVIGEDNSTDATREICRSYKSLYPDKIRPIERSKNVGAVRNYLDTYKACKGEYVAFLEGDDFWTDPTKLQKQVDFLENNSDYAVCFHNVYVSKQDGQLDGLLFGELADTLTVRDLCAGDFISTPSCMVRNRQIKEIPDWVYNLPGCDWPFDILNAECGKIKCLPDVMAAYRKHDNSLWSGLNHRQQYETSINLASELDRHFGFRYHAEFTSFIRASQIGLASLPPPPRKLSPRKRFKAWLRSRMARIQSELLVGKSKLLAAWNDRKKLDLIIIDDAFPHPQSAFRLEEYNVYLKHFPKMKIFTTGRAFNFFKESRSTAEVIRDHATANSCALGKVSIYDESPVNARLAYALFAGNSWQHVEYFERNKLPFVFTLYPGGSFYIVDAASDTRLRRVFDSPMFRRVIVTQKLTLDYLIRHGLCPADKIEFIYGVVTPEIHFEAQADKGAQRFGFGKDTLDICFTAHKYTADGRDKGYDIFLEIAKILAKSSPEYRFHVVGGFSAEDLPIDGLEGRIAFYGGRPQEWFSKFYSDKDILLSCNVPFVIQKGAFDGFPTGSATDAMLNQLALICTDPLSLNLEFKNGRDIIIAPHDVGAIVAEIQMLKQNPTKLREISKSGCAACRRIYSFESQMIPRLRILNEELARNK